MEIRGFLLIQRAENLILRHRTTLIAQANIRKAKVIMGQSAITSEPDRGSQGTDRFCPTRQLEIGISEILVRLYVADLEPCCLS